MPETLRCFLAVPLTTDLISDLTRVQGELLGALPEAESVRWVSPVSMHLTLKFLGDDVDRALPYAIADVLRPSLRRLKPTEFRVEGLGAFPSSSRSRVLWAGVEDASGGLAETWEAVEAAMEELGVLRSERPFEPHITLGRYPRELEPNLETILEPFSGRLIGRCRAMDVLLFSSISSTEGVRYETLCRASLGDSQSRTSERQERRGR